MVPPGLDRFAITALGSDFKPALTNGVCMARRRLEAIPKTRRPHTPHQNTSLPYLNWARRHTARPQLIVAVLARRSRARRRHGRRATRRLW